MMKETLILQRKFNCEIIPVVDPADPSIDINNLTEAFVAEGKMINSEMFDGLNNKEAIVKIIDYLEEKGIGKKSINYRLRGLVNLKTTILGVRLFQ